jgi:histidine triad (HIT) family protein
MADAGPANAPHDAGCVFCRIVAGQIPCYKVYEDDVLVSFLDIGPIVFGHTLVVPKAHYRTVMETPAELLAALNARLPALTRAVLEATGRRACHVLANNGTEASQAVDHLHYHILPRYEGDGYRLNWPAAKLDGAEAAGLRAKIQAALAGGREGPTSAGTAG